MASPFEEYQTYESLRKKPPVVPEPQTYGLVFVGIMIAFFLWRRMRDKR